MRNSAIATLMILLLSLPFLTIAQEPAGEPPITDADLVSAARVIGLEFTAAERDTMMSDLIEQLHAYQALREIGIGNDVPPAVQMRIPPPEVSGQLDACIWSDPGDVQLPDNSDDLAFYSVAQLSALIHSGKISSVELTRFFLDRLEKHGPTLECVITLLREEALEKAAKADAELAAGKYRGPLHGIPFGAKDLFAWPTAKTTWGAAPYKDQQIDDTATVLQKLDEAGAILVAKLTLGALAWGDVWYGGTTKNPWNLEQGSSGSSAGSASAVSAGLVPFALGTETWGSIVSPSTRCGVTGLRPTFGRVSRAGAMALSWSMDKVGPISREVEDCAMVFDVIRGADPRDASTCDHPFIYRPEVDLSKLRIGYLKGDFEGDHPWAAADSTSLEVLRSLGAELVPIQLPEIPFQNLSFILSAEAAAAFEELTLTNRDDELVRQVRYAWPNVFRGGWMISAVDYIQANRARTLLMRQTEEMLGDLDLYLAPSFSDNLLMTNLTGHPCVVVPNGLSAERNTSICFMGRLYGEATLLAAARAYQEATEFHRMHPGQF